MIRVGLAAAFFYFVASDPGQAHTAAPGLGGFTSAMVHAVTESPAPLVLMALGLLLGSADEKTLASGFVVFAVAMLLALAVTLTAGVLVDQTVPLLVLALVAGLSTASALPLPPLVPKALACAAGAFFGVLATPDPAPLVTVAYAVAGGLVAACWTLMCIAAAVFMARQRWDAPWLKIGLRVLGSWIGAIALLLLALQFAPVSAVRT